MEEMKDAYGRVVDPLLGRHPCCRCPVPCQRRFICRSRYHVPSGACSGYHLLPGCAGVEGQSCLDCRVAERAAREHLALEPRTELGKIGDREHFLVNTPDFYP